MITVVNPIHKIATLLSLGHHEYADDLARHSAQRTALQRIALTPVIITVQVSQGSPTDGSAAFATAELHACTPVSCTSAGASMNSGGLLTNCDTVTRINELVLARTKRRAHA